METFKTQLLVYFFNDGILRGELSGYVVKKVNTLRQYHAQGTEKIYVATKNDKYKYLKYTTENEIQHHKVIYQNQVFGPFPVDLPTKHNNIFAEYLFVFIRKLGNHNLLDVTAKSLFNRLLWNNQQKHSLCWQLAIQVKSLHDQDILHCDIKPGNIAIKKITPPTNLGQYPLMLTAKLLDFGLSRKKSLLEDYDQLEYPIGGTSIYMPSDIHNKKRLYTKADDIFPLD